MTPPKITRPAVPEPTFPAFYVKPYTEQVWKFTAHNEGFDIITGEAVTNPEFNVILCTPKWERLPSGTQITFTQP